MVCTGLELLNKELQHLREALSKCKYPMWPINKVRSKFLNSNWQEGNTQDNTTEQGTNGISSNTTESTPKDKPGIGHIVIPYIQGLGENIKKICSKYGIQTHLKGNRTLKHLLVKPKGQNPMEKKSGAIYMYQCRELICSEEYIGETSRTLGKKVQGTPEGTLSHPCAQLTNWT